MGNISCGYILWVSFYFWTIYLVGNIKGCPQDIHMCTQDIKLRPTTYTHKIYTKYLVEYMWWVYHVDNTIYIVGHMFYVVGTHVYLVDISCGYILWVYLSRNKKKYIVGTHIIRTHIIYPQDICLHSQDICTTYTVFSQHIPTVYRNVTHCILGMSPTIYRNITHSI